MDLQLIVKNKQVFKDMNVFFAPSIEVIKVVETSIKNHL
jgi:hypothetical protein